MRGQLVLFNHIFDLAPVEAPFKRRRKQGRSQGLIAERDKRLLYRYYYYVYLLEWQYCKTITALSRQFDLSETRIIELMAEKRDDLKTIFSEKPAQRELQRIYPWMNWME